MVESHQMLTVPEVAAFLRVSKPTVYGMINRGELPCGHFGRQIRVYDYVDVRFILEDMYAKLRLCAGETKEWEGVAHGTDL